MNNFSHNIKEIRVKKNIKLEDAAALSNLSIDKLLLEAKMSFIKDTVVFTLKPGVNIKHKEMKIRIGIAIRLHPCFSPYRL